MRVKFSIANRIISDQNKPLVIAEVGINHEGDMGKALQLVDAAAVAGCEVIKFQCHIVDKEMVNTGIQPPHVSEPLWNIIERCSLTAEQELQLKAYSEQKGMIYLSTPFSREAADRLDAMGVPAFKIGSGECNNLPLLRHIASKGKPIILSTGMNELSSIIQSVQLLSEYNIPLALMHCVSIYPTPYSKMNLAAITQLKQQFPELEIGLSDHSVGIWTCLGAVALGINFMEKHFTVSRAWPGPDMALSIEPQELRDLLEGSTAIWQARGGHKLIQQEERGVIDFAYASVVTTRSIAKGETLSRDNIWVKRPGTGHFLAKDFTHLLGKVAKCDIAENCQLQSEHIQD
jgi:sialic acid synthase SpsE